MELKLAIAIKEIWCFLGAERSKAKSLSNLSQKTPGVRKKQKKNLHGIRAQKKKLLKLWRNLETPCLLHSAKGKEKLLTTDPSNTWLGVTFWQQKKDRLTKRISLGKRFSNETKIDTQIENLFRALFWCLEKFTFRIYSTKHVYTRTTKL